MTTHVVLDRWAAGNGLLHYRGARLYPQEIPRQGLLRMVSQMLTWAGSQLLDLPPVDDEGDVVADPPPVGHPREELEKVLEANVPSWSVIQAELAERRWRPL